MISDKPLFNFINVSFVRFFQIKPNHFYGENAEGNDGLDQLVYYMRKFSLLQDK